MFALDSEYSSRNNPAHQIRTKFNIKNPDEIIYYFSVMNLSVLIIMNVINITARSVLFPTLVWAKTKHSRLFNTCQAN